MKSFHTLCLLLLASLAAGCGSESSGWELLAGGAETTDAGAHDDVSRYDTSDSGAFDPADVAAATDALTSEEPLDFGSGVDPGTGVDTGSPDEPDPEEPEPGPDPEAAYSAEMTYVSANIGRSYGNRADVRAVLDKVGDVVGGKTSPRFIGWQEIGEGDPCGGSCEIEEIRARFGSGWATYRPRGTRPDGGTEAVKVPITGHGANNNANPRATFASPGWAGVSPTRFVTTTHHPARNVSIINTHLIAGAWSCKSNVSQRRDYWRRGWRTLKAEVAKEHDKGRNVVVTGDLNRPRTANNCNPAWDPASLHPSAKIVGGAGIDYIYAVPAPGKVFNVSKRADGSAKRGDITLGIDGHKAHWVIGRFRTP